MRVAFIGAGRVGLSLALFMKGRGVDVVGVYSRSASSRARAEALLGRGLVFESMHELPGSDIVFLTVSDGAIASVAEEARRIFPDAVMVHTSGAHPSSLIPGSGRASLHPLQSLSDVHQAQELIPESLFTLEGDETGVETVGKLLDGLGLRYEIIDERGKVFYHAAAVVASNYLVTLMERALRIMELSGFPVETGLEGLVALARGTLKNIEVKGVPDALTGPIARGDWDTVRMHVNALRRYPQLLDFYRFMGKLTANMIGDEWRIHEDTGP